MTTIQEKTLEGNPSIIRYISSTSLFIEKVRILDRSNDPRKENAKAN